MCTSYFFSDECPLIRWQIVVLSWQPKQVFFIVFFFFGPEPAQCLLLHLWVVFPPYFKHVLDITHQHFIYIDSYNTKYSDRNVKHIFTVWNNTYKATVCRVTVTACTSLFSHVPTAISFLPHSHYTHFNKMYVFPMIHPCLMWSQLPSPHSHNVCLWWNRRRCVRLGLWGLQLTHSQTPPALISQLLRWAQHAWGNQGQEKTTTAPQKGQL